MIRKLENYEHNIFNELSPHILQTTQWGNFLQSSGREVEFLLYSENTVAKNAYMISFNKIPLLNKKIAYLQKCSMPTQELIEYIKLNHKDVFYIKFEPHILSNTHTIEEINKLKLRKSNWEIFLPNSFIIDLKPNIEEIYQKFNKNTKRNIKKAKNLNIEIEERFDKEAINEFLTLNKETIYRQGYFTHNDEYYKKMWDGMRAENKAVLLLARNKGDYIGSIILFYDKNILYYPYGASGRSEKSTGAMPLLHYSAIQRSKGIIPSKLNNRDLISYDLWGSLEQDPAEDNPLFGVHNFKRGFGGELFTYIGSYDYIINPILYALFSKVSLLRKRYYNLRKSLNKKS